MVVFILALASLIIFDLGYVLRFDRRAARRFSEGIQAHYALKSAINFGRVLLEIPKIEGIREDWLGEPWAVVGSAPSLPLPEISGDVRLSIVDEYSKINLNGLAPGSSARNPAGTPNDQNTGQEAKQASPDTIFWGQALSRLFSLHGFGRENYDKDEYRTLGHTSLPAGDQVAAIIDWMDRDKQSFSSPSFEGEGIESRANPLWFYNRNFKNLEEILLVPGMTLERFSKIGPFIRIDRNSSSSSQVNINTAPLEILLAMGFSEAQANDIVGERSEAPITREQLDVIASGEQDLRRRLNVRSRLFTIYSQIKFGNVTKWARAIIKVQNSRLGRKTTLDSLEIY